MNRLRLLLLLAFCTPFVLKAEESQIINIQTERLSLILHTDAQGNLLFDHFGNRIDDPTALLLRQTYRRSDYGTDNLAYGTEGGRNFRYPALAVTGPDGGLNTELTYLSHTTQPLSQNRAIQTRIILQDRKTGLLVTLIYNAFQVENVITTQCEIRNVAKAKVTLRNFYSPGLSIKAGSYLLTHFAGAWAQEMGVEHTLLTTGSKVIESRKGVRTTHTENPSFLLSLNAQTFDENYGEVIAGALAWSGNYSLHFEVDEFGILTLLGGINPYASAYQLEGGKSFVTPEMAFTYSDEGAGGASRNLHKWARSSALHNRDKICPTLLNSWEGAYFDFNTATLCKMVDVAASMGLEMFVLDDGWFGNKYPRNNSKQGLGDWQVNQSKLPEGIDFIADYTHQKGLKFGIWIEPEMVNPRSELAEKHPEWIVGESDRERPTIRQQWLLDLSNPKVQDFVFGVFDKTLQLSPKIDYIKWDANRHAESIGSSYLADDKQSHFWIDYTLGFYQVMDRIRAKYPKILIQACASGGGRVDYGALKYFDEVWASDNTEALSRLYIQYGTNLIYPACITGSHVSATPNHQTGNITPLKFRFDVAAAGRLGMELQPQQMTDDERQFAQRAISSYQQYRDIVAEGNLYRIGSPYDKSGFYALMYVSEDRQKAVVFAYCIHYPGRTHIPQFRLRGLDPALNYRVKELNVDRSKFWGNDQLLSGQVLTQIGINPPLSKLYDSGIYYLEAE